MTEISSNPNVIQIPFLDPAQIAFLGSKALGRFLEAPIEGLTPEILIGAASLGATENDVAKKFPEVGKSGISVMKAEIIEASGSRNMANVVDMKIVSGELPVAVDTRKRPLTLNDRQTYVLRLIAAGFSNTEIAERLDKSVSVLNSNINKKLFAILGANGRTHSVRRARERGVFPPS